MILEPSKKERLEYLLGKSRLEGISKSEEEDLRNVLSDVTPSSKDLSLDELTHIGLLITGLDSNLENFTLRRLDDQIMWYDAKSKYNQIWFKRLKIIEIISAALIPIFSGLSAMIPHYVIIIGGMGSLIVVIEAIQGLYQFQNNWVSFRAIGEALKHEKWLWLQKAGPYVMAENPDRLLAERVESLISTEHEKWVLANVKAMKKTPIEEK